MTDLGIIVVVSMGTLLLRASLVGLVGSATLPPRVEEALRLVAPAVLSGLVVSGLFLEDGAARPFGAWHVAAAVATLVAWRSRSITLTLAAGMATVWVAQLFV